MRISLLGCLALTVLTSASAAPLKHRFLAIDEGLGNLMLVDEAHPADNWLVKISQELPRDMQLIGKNQLLISHDKGYSIYDIKTGAVLKDVSKYHDVSSVRALPGGHILVAGVDFDGKKLNKGHNPVGDPKGKHVRFVEFDENDQPVHEMTLVGDYLRIVRQTASGTYLCACNTMFREADNQGNWIKDIPVQGFEHAWKGLRLPNGNTLMSSGYGTTNAKPAGSGSAFMVEVDSSGQTVRRFGAAADVPAKIHPYFYGLFQLLPNGDIVVANWQGHRAGHNYSGEQLLEFDPSGKIVWTWSDRAFVSSLQGVLVLDGVDTSVLNDERTGVMAPVQ